MQRTSKAQRKAQAIALSAKWKGSRITDSVVRVQDTPRHKHGVITLVKR